MIKPGMYLSARYEIIDKVGSGGMADVYKARDHVLNRFVAIKILKTEYNDDKNFVKKFRGEAQSAAGLQHPNIVNIIDVGEDDGMHYIVMELIEGITLKKFIERKGRLEIREAVGIGIQIAQGMEVAHANHIIHRDIKPQNIIISREGKVKITDFGIAKATSSNTITSNAMGSVHYFSPEQARGGYCDEKSDIYSLGVTIYEMICGHVPFEGDNAVSVALLHIQNEAKTLREMDPTVPISIDKIVQKCMQKKPERRYLSVSELVADLKHAILEPDVDFVVIPDIMKENQPTIMLSPEDLNKIKESTANKENINIDTPIPSNVNLYDDIDDDDEDENVDPYDEIDDEDDEEDDSKSEKIALIVAITSAVILALVIIIVVLKLTGFIGSGNNNQKDPAPTATATVTATVEPTVEPTQDSGDEEDGKIRVPSLIAKTLEEAQKIAEEEGFVLRYTQVESAMAEGLVTGQDPAAGEKIEPGTVVNVEVSSGSGKIVIPDLSNLTLSEAKQKLVDEGIAATVVVEDQSHDEIEIGYIISSIPEANESVSASDLTEIKLFRSTGPSNKVVEVPSLLGKTVEEAKKILEEAGLVVGKESEQYSSEYPEGQIMGQSKKAGNKIKEGSVIDITISKGEEPSTKKKVPSVVGSSKDDAKKSLEDAGFVVKIEEEFSNDVEAGKVISQSVDADSEAEEGSTITIVVSKGKETVTYQYSVTVEVYNYATNPFDDPALIDPEQGVGLTEGTINVSAIYDKTVIYEGTVSSSYAEFDSNGLSFTFTFETTVECTDKSQIKLTYSLGDSILDFSGSSKVSLSQQ